MVWLAKDQSYSGIKHFSSICTGITMQTTYQAGTFFMTASQADFTTVENI